MAYKVHQQFQNGMRVKKKVDRRWMMDVIKSQQDNLNRFAYLLQYAREQIKEQAEAIAILRPPTPADGPDVPLDTLGLPPLPVRNIEPLALIDEARAKVAPACLT
mgnify:CR=1 FL=1